MPKDEANLRRIYLDWILPVYKPQKNWEKTVVAFFCQLKKDRPMLDLHLYITTDASPYGHEQNIRETLKLAFQENLHYIESTKHQGKGAALRKAVARSKADKIIYTDWDFPFTYRTYLSIVDMLASREDIDVLLPLRESYFSRLPLPRKLSHIMSELLSSLLLLPKDCQAGLKAFNQRGKDVFLQTKIDSFLFDTEFVAIARKKSLLIQTIQCIVRENILVSKMKIPLLLKEFSYIPYLIFRRFF